MESWWLNKMTNPSGEIKNSGRQVDITVILHNDSNGIWRKKNMHGGIYDDKYSAS